MDDRSKIAEGKAERIAADVVRALPVKTRNRLLFDLLQEAGWLRDDLLIVQSLDFFPHW